MADVGSGANWLVSPTREIEDKWIEVQIQERKSRIARYRQDIEDLKKGRIVELEAKIMMLEFELADIEVRKQGQKRKDILDATVTS